MTNRAIEDVLSNLELNVSDKTLTLTPHQLEEVIHDIRASSGSFLMLVESMEKELNAYANAREIKKIQQIRAHAQRNKKITEIVIEALLKTKTVKDPR